MCLNPLTLHNKGYGYRLTALPFVECPCGTCIECQNVQKLDYLIRCIATYKALPSDKWSVFFTTFTFSEENVPAVRFYQKNVDGEIHLEDGTSWTDLGIHRCFDHRLIHRFCKSFRQYYARKYSRWHKELNPATGRMHKVIDYVPSGLDLPHILLTCEFGENSTHRPHYHAIIFVPEIISWQKFHELVEHFWPYGFNKSIRFIHKDGQMYERSDYSAFEYVCKYVNKASGYMPEYLKLKDVVCEIPWYNVVPRVFTTNGFGSFLEKHLTHENYMSGKIRYDVGGKWREFLVPKYFIRKYFVKMVTTRCKECVYVPGNPIEPAHYEMKVKSESESIYSEEYLDKKFKDTLDRLKSDYIHAWSAVNSSSSFRDMLEENGCSLSSSELTEAFEKMNPQDFSLKYLSCTAFAGVSRVPMHTSIEEDLFNSRIPDTKYKVWMHIPNKMKTEYIYSKIYLFDDLYVQRIATLIHYWNIYNRQCREMSLIAKLKRADEYCKMHNIQKII